MRHLQGGEAGSYNIVMRVLGVDFGRRRIGLALSDATGSLARPWQVVPAGAGPRDSACALARLLGGPDEASREVEAIVVGLPRRLNGEETAQTAAALALAEALRQETGLPVHLQDERLSSHEAEQRLAGREPDWRVRKRMIDAVAAAIILQDHLDSRSRPAPASGGFGEVSG
jgi:putative Holliday junction resolvase